MLEFDWSKIIAASVVPVVIISACGLLCLAFYNRLAAIVARLRTFQRERFQEQEFLAEKSAAAEPDPLAIQRHQQFLEMLDVQTVHVTKRAHLVKNTLQYLLTTIGCLIVVSLALGLSVVSPKVMLVAAVVFVLGLISMFTAVVYAVSELRAALQPIELESRVVGDLAETIEGVTAG